MSESPDNFTVMLIGMHNSIEGAIRLQKYAFLSAMENKKIMKNGFYNDWKPGMHGAYSEKLAYDLINAINYGFVKTKIIMSPYGFKECKFIITEKGKEIYYNMAKIHKMVHKKLYNETNHRKNDSLFILLSDVYYKYPAYCRHDKK